MSELIDIGRSGLRVAPLGVGTWAWGDKLVWKYGREFGATEVREAFEASRAAGVQLFDTAEVYGFGTSERLLGACLGASSTQAVAATKFMPFPWRLRRGALRQALLGSLRRLGLRQVDLYQLHWPGPIRSSEVWLEEMADAVAEGLVRAVGVSNFNRDRLCRAMDVLGRHGVALASNQVEYSLLARAPEQNGVLEVCCREGVRLIAYSPLAMGLLSGKFSAASPPRGLRRARYRRHLATRLPAALAALRRIGEAQGGRTPAEVALAWLIAKGALPIPGAKSAAQARANAGALTVHLSPEEVDELDRAGA